MCQQCTKDSVATCCNQKFDIDWLGEDGLDPTTDLI
jgi:hypothetical protein